MRAIQRIRSCATSDGAQLRKRKKDHARIDHEDKLKEKYTRDLALA